MNRRRPTLWQQAVSAALAVFLLTLMPLSTAFAATKPYFRTTDAGPFAGGWFNSGTSSCAGANYQGPSYPIAANTQYRGAIMAWSAVDSGGRNGASSNLDAIALGLIEGRGTPDYYGFYTGLSGTSALSFANVNSLNVGNFWGGIFEGAALNAHCIPDYYGTKQTNLAGGWTGVPADYNLTGQRTWTGGNTAGGTIPAGNTLIVFVNGNVNITGNIIYAPHNITNVPKFALVVRGDIRISSTVTQLDGWYIAQPTSGTSRGVIWTCNNGTDTVTDSFISTNCINKLTISGALTAKQINLSRINDGLFSANPGNSSEDINYTPAMVLGGPFFEAAPGGGGGGGDPTGTIQSLISLPPVF